jgi:DNA-binding XRE family transcriptional regulator
VNKKLIAKKLRFLRGEHTQVEVAQALGITQPAYAMYESGSRVPIDEIKIRIARLYGTTVQAIFFDDIEEELWED